MMTLQFLKCVDFRKNKYLSISRMKQLSLQIKNTISRTTVGQKKKKKVKCESKNFVLLPFCYCVVYMMIGFVTYTKNKWNGIPQAFLFMGEMTSLNLICSKNYASFYLRIDAKVAFLFLSLMYFHLPRFSTFRKVLCPSFIGSRNLVDFNSFNLHCTGLWF